MKILITICLFVAVAPASAVEESALDIAKRVIADKSYAYTPIEIIISADVRDPKDDQLTEGAKEAHEAIAAYMLGDSAPEKIRIAYAIRVLAGKKVPASRTRQPVFGNFDKRKNDQFLKDALILVARLAEINKAEQGGADQPTTAPKSKQEGKEKPKPEAEGRSQ